MPVNPIDNPALYDTFSLAGQTSPGLARFSFPTRDEGWDVQVPKGSTGGNTSKNNTKPVSFDVEIYLWRDENVDHFQRWEDWRGVLLIPVKKNAPRALDIYHPQLDGLGITSVVFQSHTEPQPDGKGGATVKIKLLEYRPAKPIVTPKLSGSAGPAPKKVDPNADLKAQVATLTAKFGSP